MDRVALMGLLKIELPGQTVRLSDGGFLTWGAEIFRSKDATFGSIGSVAQLTDGVGEEIPALEITLLPPGTTAAADLSQPGYQRSTVQMWIAQFLPETGLIAGTPDLIFHGQVDMTRLTWGRSRRELAITVVSTAERMFMANEGNSLTPRFHKSVWPGETGHDNATGLTVPVAWGTESRPVNTGGAASGGSYSGGGGGGGGGGLPDYWAQRFGKQL